MYLNQFATELAPLDMTQSDEFASLVSSAHDLGIEVALPVRYVSRNQVVNGIRIHFLEWGDPASLPIVMAHGGNQSAHAWDLVSVVLAKRFHVIALDQRGHGDSEWPRDGEMSSFQMSDDLVALIRALGLDRPIIFGHSMGGQVTINTLLRHPGIAERAVIVDTGPELRLEGSQIIRNFVNANVEFDSMDHFIENVHRYDPFRSEEHIRRTARYNLMQRVDGKFVSKQYRRPETQAESEPTSGRRTLDEVKAIACPVLIVRGEQSPTFTPEAAEHFRAALPQGKLVTVPKAGHNVHGQNTPGFLAEVLPFVGF